MNLIESGVFLFVSSLSPGPLPVLFFY